MWEKIIEMINGNKEDYIREKEEEKIININSQRSHNEVVCVLPTSFSDALNIVQFLRNGSAVTINVKNINTAEAQRLIDFVSGSVFALDGYQERIGEDVFLVTPNNIAIRSSENKKTGSGIRLFG